MNDLRYYSAQDPPFSLHGFAAAEGYCRLPSGMFTALRPEIVRLAKQTAGGRVRFATDANEITIRISLSDTAIKTHMTPWNMSGAELYCGSGSTFHRVACLRPAALGEVPFEKLDGYCLHKEIDYTLSRQGSMETMTLYLPAFTGIEKVAIGLPPSCSLMPAKPYTIQPPIVFYGSSITQGACAGRPSLSYPARVCAALDADFINLGMAGNALGEKEIAEYISGLRITHPPRHICSKHTERFSKSYAKGIQICPF